jgi:hypothetical protein
MSISRPPKLAFPFSFMAETVYEFFILKKNAYLTNDWVPTSFCLNFYTPTKSTLYLVASPDMKLINRRMKPADISNSQYYVLFFLLTFKSRNHKSPWSWISCVINTVVKLLATNSLSVMRTTIFAYWQLSSTSRDTSRVSITWRHNVGNQQGTRFRVFGFFYGRSTVRFWSWISLLLIKTSMKFISASGLIMGCA